jgi:hypothetical protein
MRHSFLAVPMLAAVACVDVPSSVHAEFAPAGPSERSNFRPGQHGTAQPVDEGPAPKMSVDSAATADAGAPDGGVQ